MESSHWHPNLEFPDRKTLNIYCYGSWVYGTAKLDSDHDFIVVLDGQTGLEENRIYPESQVDVTFYDVLGFQNKLQEHEISVLECLCLEPKFVIQQEKAFSLELNLNKLREAISAKASNSWVKAKKKLEVENQPYLAKKSLWHSLRILKFGIQLAKQGRIQDFKEANNLWPEILQNPSQQWADYQKIYQPVYNQLKSDFKKVAPKQA